MSIKKITVCTLFLAFVPVLIAGSFLFSGCCHVRDEYFDIQGWNIQLSRNYKGIPFDSLEINFRAKVVYYTSVNDGFPRTNLLGGLQACEDSKTISQEMISNISITSNADFDENHPAGAELNQFFTVPYWGRLTTYIALKPHPEEYFDLQLHQEPKTGKTHVFTIIYEQTNGEKYEIKTEEITFK